MKYDVIFSHVGGIISIHAITHVKYYRLIALYFVRNGALP